MLSFTGSLKICVALHPIDLRKSLMGWSPNTWVKIPARKRFSFSRWSAFYLSPSKS